MKVSIIHNLYKKNPYVSESVRINLHSLRESKTDFQYILFNDHGDESIYDDVKEYIGNNVEYHYSDKNWGQKICSGGWVGAQPLIKGDLIHNTGQDDVFTPLFYRWGVGHLKSDENLSAVFCNCFMTDENLKFKNVMLPIQEIIQYHTDPLSVFRWWFGVGENGRNEVTRANNMIPAPGTIYKKSVHDRIGFPDLDNFLGAADFEFWTRMLFNGLRIKEITNPLWLYRCSNLSTSTGNDDKIKIWVDKIKEKYYSLYKTKYGN